MALLLLREVSEGGVVISSHDLGAGLPSEVGGRVPVTSAQPPAQSMRWQLSDRFDPAVLPLADRHYNRRAVGSPQFVPPGRCVVLRTPEADAFWITSWPFAEYVRHAWPGAWVCSAFRNESPHLSSELIIEALSATLAVWPEPPGLGMVTFVDASKVRRKRDPGRCYLRAGFKNVGHTKGGLVALQLLPAEMPQPVPAIYSTLKMDYDES